MPEKADGKKDHVGKKMQRFVSQKPICNMNNSAWLLCCPQLSFGCNTKIKLFHSASEGKKNKPHTYNTYRCADKQELLEHTNLHGFLLRHFCCSFCDALCINFSEVNTLLCFTEYLFIFTRRTFLL